MRFREDLDERVDEWGCSFYRYAGCCRDRKIDHKGWCRTCGIVIAWPEEEDKGIPTIMRMSRERLATIRPHWTPAKVDMTQPELMLSEQDRHDDPEGDVWGRRQRPLSPLEERIDRAAAWRR